MWVLFVCLAILQLSFLRKWGGHQPSERNTPSILLQQHHISSAYQYPFINELGDFEVAEAHWSYNDVEKGMEPENVEDDIRSMGGIEDSKDSDRTNRLSNYE